MVFSWSATPQSPPPPTPRGTKLASVRKNPPPIRPAGASGFPLKLAWFRQRPSHCPNDTYLRKLASFGKSPPPLPNWLRSALPVGQTSRSVHDRPGGRSHLAPLRRAQIGFVSPRVLT